MQKFILTLLLFLTSNVLFSQKSTLTIKLKNTSIKSLNIIEPNKFLNRNFLKQGYTTLKLDAQQTVTKSFDLNVPHTVILSAYEPSSKKDIYYSLFITPGDQLIFTAALSEDSENITVSGKGSNQNQPLLAQEAGISLQKFYGDTIPDRVITEIKTYQARIKDALKRYIKQYQPSSAFISHWNNKLKYAPAEQYYSFKENNKYQIRAAYERNLKLWQKTQDSLFTIKDLNNNKAIQTNEYLSLIKTFLNRKKESLWTESSKNPTHFYTEWYGNVEEGKKAFNKDNTNELCEKIINKYFTAESAAYLYTVLIENALESSIITNLTAVYDRFKERFPDNPYVSFFQPHIEKIKVRQAKKLTDQMIFATNDGKNLNRFEEVLTLMKGKTVLLDMWGTWCGPCREEIEKNGKEIKNYFQGKGLNYLYVANFDVVNEQKWKELIPYFDLQGLHILANQKLTEDIMAKIKGNGYPTYAIIKKDGTFELSKAGYPMDREILIKQLEEALKMPN